LRRFHEKAIEPYNGFFIEANSSATYRFVTLTFLFCSFAFGYCASLLRNNEYHRRRMYAISYNFATIFDPFMDRAEKKYNEMIENFMSFDSTFYFWQKRQLRI